MEKNFDQWNEIKKRTNTKERELFFREGEVWWVNLGVNVGVETDGSGSEFLRPVIVLKKYNESSFLAIPLSKSLKMTKYRFELGMVNNQKAFLNLSQLKNLDSKRLVNKIESAKQEIFIMLKEKVSRMIIG